MPRAVRGCPFAGASSKRVAGLPLTTTKRFVRSVRRAACRAHGFGRLATALGLVAACTLPGPRDASTDREDTTACVADGSVTLDAGACWVLGRNESHCAELLLGSGRDGTLEDFHAFQPGDVVWVTPGSQGLQHIVVAVRGRGFDRTNPLVGLRIVRASDCVSVGYLRFRLPFHSDLGDPGLFTLEAVRVTLLDNIDPLQYCSVLGHDVVLLADLDDGAGHIAHREVVLHVGGIDPTIRPDLRQAWLAACGLADAGLDAGADVDASRQDP